MKNLIQAAIVVLAIASAARAQLVTQQSLADSLVDAAARHQARIATCRQELVENLRKLQSEQARVESAAASLASIQSAKPIRRDTWKSLVIGEFESQAEFEQRQRAERLREQLAFEAQERNWKAELSSREKVLNTLVQAVEAGFPESLAATRSLASKAESIEWEVPPLPTFDRSLNHNEITLPKFDRLNMSFGPVAIRPSGVTEVRASRPGNLVARIEESNTATIRITLPSLEEARKFKERFEAGEITCVVAGGLEYRGEESPILVQPEVSRYKESVDIGAAARSIGVVLFGLAAGSDSDSISRALDAQAPVSPNMTKVVVRPEIKEAGTRYHFQMSPDSVVFVDKRGNAVREAMVSLEGEFVRVKTITPTAQSATRVLQPGDRIVRVGGRETRDGRSLRSALRAYKPGQLVDVYYRRKGSEADLHFRAEGGRPLGVTLE